jgi:hypothetical protein
MQIKTNTYLRSTMHFRRTGRRKANLLLSFALFLSPAYAIWPFPPKRFTGNALIDAGSMGLGGAGRVIAFGDFNGDQLSVRLSSCCHPVMTSFPQA